MSIGKAVKTSENERNKANPPPRAVGTECDDRLFG